MNGFFASGQMSSEEKQNILDQHKTIYDGYVTRQNQNLNPQPLYVQDFANDKGGIVVNNKGNVKPYSNVGINESMEEAECVECGYNEEEMTEDLGTEKLRMGKKYRIKTPSYYEDDVEFTGELPLGDEGKSMYSFKGPKSGHSMNKKGVEDYIFDPEEMDDDIKESFKDQRNQIIEMFNRFKNYN